MRVALTTSHQFARCQARRAKILVVTWSPDGSAMWKPAQFSPDRTLVIDQPIEMWGIPRLQSIGRGPRVSVFLPDAFFFHLSELNINIRRGGGFHFMKFRARKQVEEAFSSLNQWYCAQYHGKRIEDENALLMYYIRSGGAADFAKRYEEAMSPLNRYYCSKYYGRDISDEETLWNYYMYFRGRSEGDDPPNGPDDLPIAC